MSLLGLYDGAALLGYATLWSTPEWPDYVLLDYLGVTAARRNGGLGGAILKMLAAREAGRRRVLVEAEAERSGGPEEERALRDPEYQTRMAAVLAWVCLMDTGAVPS